jgi:hypothetical protein
MCFYISKKNPEPIVAQEKIIVYKYLSHKSGKLISPIHYDFYWKPNKLYTTELSIVENGIYEGFHAYTDEVNCKLNKDYYTKVCKMVIPKGATYYINVDNKQIVSNQMILKFPWYGRIANFFNSINI